MNAGKKENYQSRSDKKELLQPEKTETADEMISASLEKFHLIIIRPNLNSININKDSIQTLTQDKKSIKIKKEKKSEVRDNEKPPVNYYANWALIMGLISLTAFPLIIPLAIGPLNIFLGIIALLQIKHSHERGKGMAIFAIIIGTIWTALLLLMFITLTFIDYPLFMPVPVMFLIALGFLIFNYILYLFIKQNLKNPENSERAKKYEPLDRITNGFLISTIVFAILTGGLIFIGAGLGPITWMMASRALQNIPKEKSNRRLVARLAQIIGILGTIAIFVLVPLFISTGDWFFALIALLTLLIAILFTIIGIIKLAVTPNPAKIY